MRDRGREIERERERDSSNQVFSSAKHYSVSHTYHGKHNSTFGAALEGYLLRSDVCLSTILSHINHSTSSALLSPHALYEHVDLLYRRVVLIADRCDEKIVKETKVSVFEYIAQLLPSYSPTASRGHNNQTRAALVRSGQQVG